MKKLIILFLLIPITSNAQVIKEKDEFTGKVSWKSDSPKEILVEDGDIIRALYSAVYSEENWVIAIYALSSSESIYSNDMVYFLADGQRIQLSVAARDVEFKSGNIVSYVGVMPTKKDFYTIGFAGKVRVKIGNVIFNMPKESRLDMRRISRMVDEDTNQ